MSIPILDRLGQPIRVVDYQPSAFTTPADDWTFRKPIEASAPSVKTVTDTTIRYFFPVTLPGIDHNRIFGRKTFLERIVEDSTCCSKKGQNTHERYGSLSFDASGDPSLEDCYQKNKNSEKCGYRQRKPYRTSLSYEDTQQANCK